MCYSRHEDAEKTVQNDLAQEDPRQSAPEAHSEKGVMPEPARFWTFRTGRRDRTTEEATTDRAGCAS
ncbi:MAG: hypothetical protein JWR57_823 [Mycetocola sp.]|jgi:hypothetical protein|nr:hypothetical protein [Mycetocola sp.]